MRFNWEYTKAQVESWVVHYWSLVWPGFLKHGLHTKPSADKKQSPLTVRERIMHDVYARDWVHEPPLPPSGCPLNSDLTTTYVNIKSTTIILAMSLDNSSLMSSAISVTGTESFSDNGSTLSPGEDKTSIAQGNTSSNLFDLGDGDFRIVVSTLNLQGLHFLLILETDNPERRTVLHWRHTSS